MPPDPLTNLEIQKHCQNKPKFCTVYSRNMLSKIKDGAYIIGTHCTVLYVTDNKET